MKTKKAPLILCSFSPIGANPRRLSVNEAYAKAIGKAGAGLCMLTAVSGISKLIEHADGLLLPGGGDIHPQSYGKRTTHSRNVSPERDALEFALLSKALERQMPVLALCRGLQILNVFLGGTLWQDISEEREPDTYIEHDRHDHPCRDLLAHDVTIYKGSALHRIIRTLMIRVNSMHHQGIRELGKLLTVNAVANDGLIEGVELARHPFCVGVQWHPEELVQDPASEKLLRAFVRAAKAYRAAKE